MKEKISYFIGALICYSIVGIVTSYFSFDMINWKYVGGWTFFMSIFDFLIIRNLRSWLNNKNKNKYNNGY